MVRPPRLIGQLLAYVDWLANWQDAILVAVVVEDVGETRRDHTSYTLIQQSPGRVLTRRATAEVLARNQDARSGVFWPVQYEIGPRRAVRQRFQFVEQALGQACAFGRLKELLGNDHVGIDIGHRLALFEQRRSGSGELRKGFHEACPSVKNAR